MKATPDLVETFRAAIEPWDTPERREVYRHGDFPRASAVNDLDTRYRWDLFYLAVRTTGWDAVDGLATNHIDTMLKRIVPPLVYRVNEKGSN